MLDKLLTLITQKQDCGLTHNGCKQSLVTFNEELAEHLIANGVTIQQWIPVMERLPEPEVNVLAFNGDYVFVSQYYCSHFASWDKEGHMVWVREQYAKDPTHWMPLPVPPMEGQK